jgi:peptidoglycan/LPS O-acetylase OafA/YrhL
MWLQFFWGVTAFFLVAPAVFGPQDQGMIRRGLNNRVLQWLGLISYGIYLWHEAVIDWYLRLVHATPQDFFHFSFIRVTLFMLFFTIIFATISYYCVERPALRLKDRDLRAWLRSHTSDKTTVRSGPPER